MKKQKKSPIPKASVMERNGVKVKIRDILCPDGRRRVAMLSLADSRDTINGCPATVGCKGFSVSGRVKEFNYTDIGCDYKFVPCKNGINIGAFE